MRVTLRRSLLGAVPACVMISTSPAMAQAVSTAPATTTQAPPPQGVKPTIAASVAQSAPATQVQEVVVTGSLFRRTNTETPSPVTLLTAEELSKEGITNISDAVRSVSADNSGTIPNAFGVGFAAGASGVSLRGLTAADTLVLIDGLRTVDYPIADDGVRNFVDLNTIPDSVLDRVEVLKDGASSIYGSDAVAGVVNIITKQSYDGFEADASYGDSQHGGGNQFKTDAILGHGDLGINGYNAYIDFEYQNDNKIGVGQRGFPYNTFDLSSIGGFNDNGGQPGLDTGSIYGSVTRAKLAAAGNLTSGVPIRGAVAQVLAPSGCGPLGATTTDSTGTYCQQNFANYGDDQPQEQRWGAFGRFTKQLGHDNQVFVNVYYYENFLAVNASPPQIQSGAPLNTNGIALPPTITVNGVTELNPNDPFVAGMTLAQAERSKTSYALLNYAFGDIPNETTLDNHVVRGVAGAKGKLFGFDYEADVTIAHSGVDTVESGLINYDQLLTDINDGAYSFINPAANSAATLSALAPVQRKTSTSDLDSLDVHVSRDLYPLPGGPLALALGAQARYEAISDPELNVLNADGTATPSSVLNLGLAETQGHRDVEAFYFEVDAPLIKNLDLNVSGRYDHYSDFGGNFSPKVGLKYTPLRQLALRATYAQGFRAPSFSQNGSSQSEGFITYNPSTGGAPASFIKAHNGDGYVQQYSLGEFTVANPAIQPETSESYTLGFVYEPAHFFNISVDYYHIKQGGIIAQSDPAAVLQAYYNGTPLPSGSSITLDNPDSLYPNAPRRVLVVEAPFVNANALTTRGLDVDLRANFHLPYDVHYTSDMSATDILGYQYTSGGVTQNYVGTQAPYYLSSGAGTPKYRVNWVNSFTRDKATISGTVNFVSGIKETGIDATDTSDLEAGCLYGDANGTPFPRSCHVKGFWTFDLTGSYKLTPRIELYADILNLFDKSPSLDPADYAGTNYNATYDQEGIIGRYFRAGVHFKF